MAWDDDPISTEKEPRRAIDLGFARRTLDRYADDVSAVGNAVSAAAEQNRRVATTTRTPAPSPTAEMAYNFQTGEWAIQANDGTVRVVDKSPATLFALSDMELSPITQIPEGFRPVPQAELREMLASVPEDSDFWGEMGSSFMTSVGLAASAIDAMIGNDDPSNALSRKAEEYTAGQTVGQYKASKAPWFTSLPGFKSGLGQTIGNIGGAVATAAPIAIGTAAATGNPVASAATGALAISGAAGAAGEQATDFYDIALETMSEMSEEELVADSPVYAQARADGMPHEEAMRQTAIEGARAAMAPAAGLGALEGIVGGVVGRQVLSRLGAGRLLGRAGEVQKRSGALPTTGRIVGRGLIGGVAAGTEEVAETALGQSAGARATGIGNPDPRAHINMGEFEQASQGGFLLGALGGRGHSPANAEASARKDIEAALGAANAPANPEAEAQAQAGIVGGIQQELPLPAQPAPGPEQVLAQAVQQADMQAIEQLGQQGVFNSPEVIEAAAQSLGITSEQLGEAVEAILQGATVPTAQPGPVQPDMLQPPAVASEPRGEPVPPNLIERRQFQQMQQQEAQAASEQNPQALPSSGVSEIEQEIQQLTAAIEARPKRDPRLKFLREALKDAEARWQEAKLAAGPQGVQPYVQVDSPEPLAAPEERTADGRPLGVAPAPLANPEPMPPGQEEQAAQTRAQRRKQAGVAPAQPADVAAAAASSQQQVSPSTAEPVEDVQAQVEAMVAPDSGRDAVFIAEGTAEIEYEKLPPEVRIVNRAGIGVLLTTNANKATKFRTKKNLVDEDIARMLGYSENKADVIASGEAPVVVEARDKKGRVAAQQISTPKNARAAAAAVKKQARKDAAVVVTTPEEAQADRAARAPKNEIAAKAAERKAARRDAVKKKSPEGERALTAADDAENNRPASKRDRNARSVQDKALARTKGQGAGSAAPRLDVPSSAQGKAETVTTKAGAKTIPASLLTETGQAGEVVDLTVASIDEAGRFQLEALREQELTTADMEKVEAALLRADQLDTFLDAAVDAAEERLLDHLSQSEEGRSLMGVAEQVQLRAELAERKGQRGRPLGRPKTSPLEYVPLTVEEMLSFGRLLLRQAKAEVAAGIHGAPASVARRMATQLLPGTSQLMTEEISQRQVVEMISLLDEAYVDQLVHSAAKRLRDSFMAKQVMRGASEVARVHVRQNTELAKVLKRVDPRKRTPESHKAGPVTVVTAEDLELEQVSRSHVESFRDDLPDAAVETVNEWVQLMERGGIKMTGELQVMSLAVARQLHPAAFAAGNPTGRYAKLETDGKITHVVAVDWGRYDDATMVEALAHEFGHYVSFEVFNRSDRSTQVEIMAAYRRWLQAHGELSPNDLFKTHAPGLMQGLTVADELSFEYASSFKEWSANHIARFLLTRPEPRSTVEKYFARVAEILRKVYAKLLGTDKPNEAWAAAMDNWISGAATLNAKPHFRLSDAAPNDMQAFGPVGDAPTDPEGTKTAQAILQRTTSGLKAAKQQATDVARMALTGDVKGLDESSSAVARKVMTTAMGAQLRKWGLSLSTLDQIERMFRNKGGKFGTALTAWVTLQKRKAQLARVAMFGGSFEGTAFVGAATVLERANHLTAKARGVLQEMMYYATHYAVHPDKDFDAKENAHLSVGVSDEVLAVNQRHYQHVRNLWDQLGVVEPGAHAVYTQLRDAFADLHEKTLEQQIQNLVALKASKSSKPLSDEAIDQAVKLVKGNAHTLKNGPYFPLMRFGNWIVSVTQPSEAQIFDSREKALAAKKEAKALHPGSKVSLEKAEEEYVVRVYRRGVYFFDSEAAALAARPQIEADLADDYAAAGLDLADVRKQIEDGTIDEEDSTSDALVTAPFHKRDYETRINHREYSQFIAEVRMAAEKQKIDPAVAAVMEELYLDSLPEFSARKSMLPRQNIKGASHKMLEAYARRYQGASNAYSMVKFGQGIQESWAEMEANRAAHSAGGQVLNNLHASQQAIADVTRESSLNTASNLLTDISSLFSLAFSPAYILTNMMQVEMITLPTLAGATWRKSGVTDTLGIVRAQKYIGEAYQGAMPFFTKRGIADFVDESKRLFGKHSEGDTLQSTQNKIAEQFGKTPAEQAMLTYMLETGRLDFSFLNSIEDAMRGSGLQQKLGNVARLGMALPQQVEAMNRTVSALAAFRVAKREMGLADAEATEYAYDVVGDTQLDYSRLNRPLLFNKQGLRVLLQFKLYMQGMYALFVRNAYLALKGATPEERKQGRATLMYLLGTHAAIGGAAGLGPLAFSAKLAVALAAVLMGRDGDDDEWKSSEQLLRERAAFVFGEKGGHVVENGLPVLIGMDVSNRLSIPIAADTRYARLRETDDTATQMNKWLVYWLGAPWANLTRVANVPGAALDDDPYTRVSDGLPAGARSTWRAFRAAREGLVDRDGDTFVGADQLNWGEVGLMAIGLQPASTARAYEIRSEEKGTMARIRAERSLLLKRWRTAEPGERDRLREEIRAFNDKTPKAFRVDAKSLSRSAAAKAERDKGKTTKDDEAIKEYLK